MNEFVKPHQWTHDGNKVLLLKCVNNDGTSYGGFKWPLTVGESVEAPDWNPAPECGGGLHGWPWGLAVGDGKTPDYSAHWLVFAADPAEVIDLGGKAKTKRATIVASGTYLECHLTILMGQIAWTQHASNGAASATGDNGAASATGRRGAASATGWNGAASATGRNGAASATGRMGAASATGDNGAASATGRRGAASATGRMGAASATGENGAASATGDNGAASATGWRGAASATGENGAASATGWRGAASATGWRGAASATGDNGIAAVTNDDCRVECGPEGMCAACADVVYWTIRRGAVLAQRTSTGAYLLRANDWRCDDGETVLVEHGVIWRNWQGM